MTERRDILDTPPRGSKDLLAPPDKVRNCWIYGTGPAAFKNIQEVSLDRSATIPYDWEGYIPDGTELVGGNHVTFIHLCSEQRRMKKGSLKGTTKVETYYGIAYKPKRDEVFE